jgi:hypothetical protein
MEAENCKVIVLTVQQAIGLLPLFWPATDWDGYISACV